MTNKTITIYYSLLGLVLVAQTIATVVSGGNIVLSSSSIAELKHERQQLLQTRQQYTAELTKQTALLALPATATDQYTAITHPIVIASSNTVASTQR